MKKFNKLKNWYGSFSDEALAVKLMDQGFRSQRKSLQKFDELLHWTWHPEYRKYVKRKEYRKNASKYIKRAKASYAKKPEAKRRYGRLHYIENAADYKNRARARGLMIKNSNSVQECSLFYKFTEILNSVHGRAIFSVDHIHPISKGGQHHPSNLQVATWAFNSWKRARTNVTPIDYFGQAAAKP